MRTTVSLPDRLLARAKKRAAERGTTLSAVVADALRMALERGPEQAKSRRFTLVTFEGKGVRPGVDLDRTSALLELEDAERVAEAAGPYRSGGAGRSGKSPRDKRRR